MSGEKEKLNELLRKVEDITVSLNKISQELQVVSASLKSLAVGQITSSAARPNVLTPPFPRAPAPTSTVPPATTSPKQRSLDDIRMSFPEELETRLNFEEKGDFIIIKPRQFLGSENFAKIASAVRGMGGEYISAGKDSHFRVPKKQT